MVLTIALCLVIVIVFAIFWFLIRKWENDLNEVLLKHKRIIEYFPSIISTLGVLGTFIGITIGLIGFDTADLNASIPKLLEGLKTAFFTSLLGMFGSIILSSRVNRLFDQNGASDAETAAARIVSAVELMSRVNNEGIGEIKGLFDSYCDSFDQQTESQRVFHRTVGNNFDIIKQNDTALATVIEKLANELSGFSGKVDSLNNSIGTLIDLQRSQETAVANIKGSTDSIVQSLGNVEEQNDTQKAALVTIAAQTVAISKIGDNVSEMLDISEAMNSSQSEIASEVKTFGERLHAEVIEIEDGMDRTNKLLTEKFDEFSELLKKSNTEALVEVMKKVTEEFQKQMDALISKLIQENFDQLNKSVERLNTWQQENKEMIASLTSQYKQMATNFEATSTSLTKVKDDTQMLVSDGGKLRQLIDSLNQVIIEDEKFIKLTSDLQSTASLTQHNMEVFDKATNDLNNWVRKQRDFVDGVQVLLAKLEEISKIKDYNEQFWQGTKKQMEEGVGIIKRSTDTLNNQLTEIDRRFYARLSTTLAELDACITSLVQQKR